jgi:hypothetical protein
MVEEALEGPPAFSVLASNRWFIVGEDEEGYGIWSVADGGGDAPLRRFPLTDQGSEAAFDAFTSMSRSRRQLPIRGALLWMGVISGIVWVATNGYVALSLTSGSGSSFGQGFDSRLFGWLNQISQTAYPTFVVSAGLYVMLWLWSRDPAPRRS